MCLLITGVCSVYVIAGVFINMPRYLEIGFLQPAFKANIAAGKTIHIGECISVISCGMVSTNIWPSGASFTKTLEADLTKDLSPVLGSKNFV